MGTRRRFYTTAVALLVACAPAASSEIEVARTRAPEAAEAVRDLVAVRVEQGIVVTQAPSGEVVAVVPGAEAAPGPDRLLRSVSEEGGTTVEVLEPVTGASLQSVRVRGAFEVAVASPKGALVALAEPPAPGKKPYLPAGRKRTTIVVADPSGAEETRRFALEGNFIPEAFSTNEKTLYLIEYVPALNPKRYLVRSMSLETGRVVPIGRLSKIAAPGQMQGTGRVQLYSPRLNELYTLYTQQREPGHGRARGRTSFAFIHLLNLRGGWAHCIDLPLPFGQSRADSYELAVSPDARYLYVVDRQAGVVAVVRPNRLRVERWAVLDPSLDRRAELNAVASSDGRLYLAAGNDILVLSSALEQLAKWYAAGTISGLNVSPDGSRLYVAVPSEVTIKDTASGERVGSIAIEGASEIENVIGEAD